MDYENKFIYRLILVVTVLAFLGASGISLVAGWYSKPTPEVDDKNTYLTCENGKSYNLNANKIYVYSVKTTSLSSYQDVEARKLCAYEVLNDYSVEYLNLKIPLQKNYTLHIAERVRGGWFDAALWVVLGIGGSYIVLNLIRETLNYVFLGKKFDWVWLAIPLALFDSANQPLGRKE